MLYAELQHKLSPDRSDHERREDILTSTVFGTLLTADARALLAGWLRQARGLPGQSLEVDSRAEPFDYWFWPWVGKEPDVVLRMGPQLVIIEVKYRSPLSKGGRRGHDREDEGERTLDERSTPVGESGSQLVEE